MSRWPRRHSSPAAVAARAVAGIHPLVPPAMAHPWGVRPVLGEADEETRRRSLGALALLQDELLLDVLSHLAAADLCRLSCASRYLCAFANDESLWRGLVLACDGQAAPGWRFEGSWQETHLAAAAPGYRRGSKRPRPLPGIASDLLHQPAFYAGLRIDPQWLAVDNVDRVRAADLGRQAFVERYERPGRPLVLTDVVPAWPAAATWTRARLSAAFAGRHVIVGDAPMDFDAYCHYADTNSDELPL